MLREVELEGFESWQTPAAIRLLALTGCRLSEILKLRWDDVHLEAGIAELRQTKTGPRAVYFGAAALGILSALPSRGASEWVIPGRDGAGPWVNLSRPWGCIRRRAGLEDVRLHDLRHSHASVGVSLGLSLPLIGKLLGHSQPATTARYAHLAADPVREAARRVGGRIAAALEGRPTAPVVPLRDRGEA